MVGDGLLVGGWCYCGTVVLLLHCTAAMLHMVGLWVVGRWVFLLCIVLLYCCTTYYCTAEYRLGGWIGSWVRPWIRGLFCFVLFFPPLYRPRAGIVRRTTTTVVSKLTTRHLRRVLPAATGGREPPISSS